VQREFRTDKKLTLLPWTNVTQMSHRHELHAIPEQWIRPTLLLQQKDRLAICAWEIRLHVSSAGKQI